MRLLLLLSAVLFTTTYGWGHVGCFRDHPHRAIGGGIRFRGSVAKCGNYARRHHWRFFSVQYGGECFTGPISYTRHFGRYGRARNCRHGRGGGWANDVYQTQKRFWHSVHRRRHRYLTTYHRHYTHWRHLAVAQGKRLHGYNVRYLASHRAAVKWARAYNRYAKLANREARAANALKKRHIAYVKGYHRVKGACNRTVRKWAHGANVIAKRQRAYYGRYRRYKAAANLYKRRYLAARRAFHVRGVQRKRAYVAYHKYAHAANVYRRNYIRYHRAAVAQRKRLHSYNVAYVRAHKAQVHWAKAYVRYAHAANAQARAANSLKRSHLVWVKRFHAAKGSCHRTLHSLAVRANRQARSQRSHYGKYKRYRKYAHVYHGRYVRALHAFKVRGAQRKRAYALYHKYLHISQHWAKAYNNLRRHG